MLTIPRAPDNILVSDRLPIYLDSLIGKLEDARPHVELLGYLIALSLIKKSSGQSQIEMARKFLDVLGLDELPDIDDLSQDHLTLEVNFFLVIFFVLIIFYVVRLRKIGLSESTLWLSLTAKRHCIGFKSCFWPRSLGYLVPLML